jgi:ABC-type uncharacterized transport system auxiliary subunit
MKKIGAILLLSAVTLILSGCFARPPQMRYYTLDYTPSPTQERLERGAYPYNLRVRPLTITEAYRRQHIVYRQSAHELNFYNYHRWAVRPERLITDLIVKHIKVMELFQNTFSLIEDKKPDFTLSGEITAIEEYSSDQVWYAHLAINLYLEENATRSVVWSRQFDYRKRVSQQEPIYVVRELSFILESILDETTLAIDELLSEYHRKQTNE